MSYTKILNWRDHQIEFEYDYQQEGLVLLSWKCEEEIPCGVESQFIERQIYKWLDSEWAENGLNYYKDFLDHLAQKRYDILQE